MEPYKLAILLYRSEFINEKFLIKLRDCFISLSANHPVKHWLEKNSQSNKLSKDEERKIAILNEVIQSHYNLITDPKVKNGIIKIIMEINGNNLGSVLLKSYLYLLVGNVARSDQLMAEFINRPPVANWKKQASQNDLYFKFTKDNVEKIILKMDKHPSDRSIFQLFVIYLKSFYNEKNLNEILEEIDTKNVEGKIDLKIVKNIAPEFINFLIFRDRNVDNQTVNDKIYWTLLFVDRKKELTEAELISLKEIEEKDKNWFLFLMGDEKIEQQYIQKFGKSYMAWKKKYLEDSIQKNSHFNMDLLKMIEFGFIDQNLVEHVEEYKLSN